jgi:hypothetical protein
MVVIVLQVIYGATVTLTEAVAEVLASFSLNWRMLVHFMVIGVGVAMLVEVMASGFDALVKAALLRFAILRRWLIPTVLIRCSTGNRLCLMGTRFQSAG